MNNPPEPAQRTVTLLDDSSREQLAVKHIDLVPRVVGRMPIALPRGVDRDDLISAGMLGLLTAARTYQPMRGASFRTFAYTAIRGAVLDELRRLDPLPRGARSRLRDLTNLDTVFRNEHGRPPHADEIATHLGLTADEVEQLLGHAQTDRLLRREPTGDDEEASEPLDPRVVQPLEQCERREDLERVEQAIAELNPRERQVVVLYYAESLYLKEIGELIGVTESRICQILACAQRKIRIRLQKQDDQEDD